MGDTIKKSSPTVKEPSSAVKILNQRAAKRAKPNSSESSTSPKHVKLSIANSDATPANNSDMDHYVLKTIKEEGSVEGVETIAFVLSDQTEKQKDVTSAAGEAAEELQISDDEPEDTDGKSEMVEHVCGKCYKTFRRFSGLKNHMEFCRYDCGYHLRKNEMLKNLDKIEKDAITMENKDVCFCCGESYDTFHLGHINCPDCPKSFKSQVSYERHIFITHSEFNDYPCSICNAKLRSANLLKLHEEQHKNRGKPFACKICGKDFTRAYHLKRHQKYSSCSADGTDTMKCKVCDKSFFRLDNLRAHLRQHLGTHVTKKPEYRCPQCKNCFYSLSTLNIHTRTHTGERPFDCDLCEKKFPSLIALKKHRRYHTGEKPYTCSVCNQSFAVKEVLNRHMKRHTGERPHSCPECNKSFIQASQLRNHARTHIFPFECSDCDQKFKTNNQLEKHRKIHTKKCYECNKTFSDQSQLEEHMANYVHKAKTKTHKSSSRKSTRRPRTECAVCGEDFKTVKDLQFHILKVHEVDPEDFVNEKPKENKTVQNSENVYKIEGGESNEVQILSETEGNAAIMAAGSVSSKEIYNNTDDGNKGGLVVKEFIVSNVPNASSEGAIVIQNEEFTVIPLDGVGPIETVTVGPIDVSPLIKKERKSLGESLAVAIASETLTPSDPIQLNEEDIKLKENVGKLLDMLVDNKTLKKFGWPTNTEENVLCRVIENCGYNLMKDAETYRDLDYATRMREYVKLLFTVVIHNDSIKELLNNYPIDEVVEYVLGNDDDEDDDVDNEDDKSSNMKN
ncbi:PREDICTED: protein suppressor of hairy wing isoform X1 [Rhagoletis zephyria]|uniref:protein suppressor of hairy wing isoform X1 n=1 Tax=Rhagoletis zephyria TaxID=28612 RepID=UPI0008114D08|nr:PREDICTED: protein suppressor of hairy wing isoform X1 [Rhagoletis zephyria]XP_017483246.1 PREDICTED: protein suppressor of hairy wing isoform X1 [Rhagoletis zephyria]XP_017483248.1 PREDICTED: protein suppressor of hairy wing isoform X1 [Rhagoletis zephyria]